MTSSKTILVTACSGVAATFIGGATVHSATWINTKITNVPDEVFETFRTHVKMIIVDEISMLDYGFLEKLNARLNTCMGMKQARYGGIDLAFMGDFRQLPPVRIPPIYKERNMTLFKHTVNCYIELFGMYRFKDDPAFGEICKRFRDGIPTHLQRSPINLIP